MKKLFTFVFCAGLGLALNAQNNFTVNPTVYDGMEVSFMVEAASENMMYIAGSDEDGNYPTLWNTTTNTMMFIMENDSAWIEGDNYWYVQPKEGTFHSVNNLGQAVGSLMGADFLHIPILFDANTGNYTVLHIEEGDDCEAFSINADGSVIVGFHFDQDWTTHGCVWTNNGTTRTDLPLPTEAQLGFPIDYVSARWVSADGNVILGYAQDFNNGEWVAVAWKRQGNEWVVDPFCASYHQTTENGELPAGDTHNPYFKFEPLSLSANGEWVSIVLQPLFDLNDWSFTPCDVAARFNLNTRQLEVCSNNEDGAKFEMFGIANDGTAVGRYSMNNSNDAIIWNKEQTEVTKISDMFTNDAYVIDWAMSALATIAGDGCYASGFSINSTGILTSFVLKLKDRQVGIQDVVAEPATPKIKGTYDLMGRKLNQIDHSGIYIIDGKKVFVK